MSLGIITSPITKETREVGWQGRVAAARVVLTADKLNLARERLRFNREAEEQQGDRLKSLHLHIHEMTPDERAKRIAEIMRNAEQRMLASAKRRSGPRIADAIDVDAEPSS
jgi:hypothetical protein